MKVNMKMTKHFENTCNLSMGLCGCLLFVVGIIGASFDLPSRFNLPIDHFINDLNEKRIPVISMDPQILFADRFVADSSIQSKYREAINQNM